MFPPVSAWSPSFSPYKAFEKLSTPSTSAWPNTLEPTMTTNTSCIIHQSAFTHFVFFNPPSLISTLLSTVQFYERLPLSHSTSPWTLIPSAHVLFGRRHTARYKICMTMYYARLFFHFVTLENTFHYPRLIQSSSLQHAVSFFRIPSCPYMLSIPFLHSVVVHPPDHPFVGPVRFEFREPPPNAT